MMSLPVLLIIIGIALAILVHWGLGVALIVVGLALLLIPQFRGTGTGTRA